jgi:DNA-binding response OmpR family regulator
MQSFKILIVDDEPEVCILLSHFFRTKNQQTHTAANIQEGLKKFEEFTPDILILDHNLPDGHGIDHIANFKKLNPSARIVLISAMPNLRERAIESGASLFLEKPISFGTLKKLLEN